MIPVNAASPLSVKTDVREDDFSAQALPEDEQEILKTYRRAKQLGFADISITIQEGKRVKFWLTEKLK